MRLDRVRTELWAQFVDHNLLQTDDLNAQDPAPLPKSRSSRRTNRHPRALYQEV